MDTTPDVTDATVLEEDATPYEAPASEASAELASAEVGHEGPSRPAELTLDEAVAALSPDATAKALTRALMVMDPAGLDELTAAPRGRVEGESPRRFQIRMKLQRQLARLERLYA